MVLVSVMLLFCTLCDAARHLVVRDFAHADQTPLQPRRGVERKRPTFSCAKAEEKTRERERETERERGRERDKKRARENGAGKIQ